MRVLLVFFITLSAAFALQINEDEIEKLFRKFMRGNLTENETQQLQDVYAILHRPEYGSIASLDKSSAVRSSLDCLICRSAFAVVFEGVQNGQTDDEISEVVVELCTTLGIESYNVCHGAVVLNVPIITYIIRTTPAATPRAFCGLVLQRADNPNVCVIDDSRFEWTVDLPPPPAEEIRNPDRDTSPLTVVLISDAHIDPLYEASGVADCDEPTCCRKGQTLAKSYIYRANINESILEDNVITTNDGDIVVDLDIAPKVRQMIESSQTRFATPRNPQPAGYWGDYRNCDSPLWVFDDVIDRIVEAHGDTKIDAVYYIGDTIDHGVWETSYELINDMNRYVIDKIRTSFGDDVLVVPTIGNHESQPTNQFAPSSVTVDYLNTTWLYNNLAEKWDHYLTPEAKETLRDRGDFSIIVRPGLRAITINSNVAYKYNWWLVYDPLDAKKHLDFLVNELYAAELVGDKVHIISHIPPGVHDLTQTWTREYNRIVNRFTKTITAEFNGHTHSDEFKIFYDTEGNPINMAWGAGSTTSYTFYNINYKMVTFNNDTYVAESIENYVYNLTEANLTPNRRPHWFKLYDMKNSFQLNDLSPASFDDLVNRMVTTNKELLDLYAAYHSKLSDSRWFDCDLNCKLDRLCNIVITVLWERERCNRLRNLYNSTY